MTTNLTPSFDVILACLFPIALFFAALRANGPWSSNLRSILSFRTPKHSYGPFSLEKAYHSYANYIRMAEREVNNRRALYKTLGRAHKRLGNAIGYPEKLDRLKLISDLNATVTQGIADLAAEEFGLGGPDVGDGDIGRVRESLKHFIRDWSADGAREREKIFQPILDILKAVHENDRQHKRILVPGSGLGRLAWEISQLGYDTTANELSFFMNLAFRFLVSPETTKSTNEHVLRPYGHWFSHQRSNDSLFRPIRFPDVVPRLSPTFHLAEADFLSLKPPSDPSSPSPPPSFTWSKSDLGSREAGYDYIVTLFFIDTSLNVFATMEHIHALLRPGGTWINLGPLLWTSGGYAKLELSLDEVYRAAEDIGFVFQDGDAAGRRTVDCEYTGDPDAMMRWVYRAEFWVATKSK